MYRKLIIIIFVTLYSISLYGYEFRVPIIATDGNHERVLVIGIHPGGSDDYVQGLDVFAPPLPPSGSFDARIVHNGESYFTKFLDDKPTEKVFLIRTQFSTGQGGVRLLWDHDILSEYFSFEITDGVTAKDMKEDSVFVPVIGTFGRPELVRITLSPEDEYLQPPDIPALIAPANTSDGQSTRLLFIWNKISLASNYNIQISVHPDFTSTVIDEIIVADTTYEAISLEQGTTYYWRVRSRNHTGTSDWSPVWSFKTHISTDIERSENSRPGDFALHQNYPNPFNPVTTIQCALPKDTHVKLEVFNMLGQRVRVLVDEDQTAGYYKVEFEAVGLPGGLYVYRINSNEFVDVKKLVYLK